MKTNNKKYIVISLVFVAICMPILFLIVFLLVRSSGSKPTNDTLIPESFPVSYTGGSQVDIDTNNDKTQYKYALITYEDFILLKNEDKQLYVNLEKRKWKEISFSPDGKLVGVLGETSKDIYDLFIYNILTKKWIQSTQYGQQSLGISNFVWINDSLVYFIQGVDADRWVHSYNYLSGEIIKLKKVDGDFAPSNYNSENIVIDNIDRFTVYDKNLNLLAEVSKQQTLENGDSVLFTQIYADFGEKFYLSNENMYFQYKNELGNKISPTQLNTIPLCQTSENTIITVEELQQNITTYSFNLESGDKTILGSLPMNADSEIGKYKCIDDNIYFFISSSVYNINDGSYNSNNILERSLDFDIL